MKSRMFFVRMASVVAGITLSGCNNGDIETPNPSAATAQDSDISASATLPNIEGAWSGTYNRQGESRDIQANISQGGSHVTILTSLDGEGHLFTGYFRSNGSLYLTDASTDQTWTSAGTISGHGFLIQDYLLTPENRLDPQTQFISFAR